MAKGNALLGQLRGKAGDLVFSRLKGQQIVKARNRQPNNPRTNSQMSNRARFAGAVQFFSRALQAQFKFAYEGKAQKISDYNAFMKYNATKGMYMMPEDIYDRSISCVGPFMMTKGSLNQPTIDFSPVSGEEKEVLNLRLGAFSGTTVGDLSAHLISKYNLLNGDILTMWVAQGNEYFNGEEWEIGSSPVDWKVAQIILDTTSSVAIEAATVNQDAHIFLVDDVTSGLKALRVGADSADSYTNKTYVTIGGACITRVIEGTVKASTSYVKLNAAAQRWYREHRSASYVAEVMTAWKATGKEILKGGIADGNNPS